MTRPDLPPPHPAKHRSHRFTGLRNNFLAGIVVIAPIGLTIWLIWTVVGWVDGWVLPFVPQSYQPIELLNRWFGTEGGPPLTINPRGIGLILFLVFTVLVGWIAKGLIGRSFLRWGENLVGRMPVIRSIYNAVKQIAETVFSQSETSFDKACLIEYPRPGIWAIAFISTVARGEVARKLPTDDEVVTVFLPTTPNPTSGFLLYIRRKDVIELDMGIEDSAKLIISAGLVYPSEPAARAAIDALNGD